MNTRKTKIVAKLADNKSEVPLLKALLENGMDVTWLNTAHQDEPETIKLVERIREVSTHLPMLLDTKGPEIRTKNVTTPFAVNKGDIIYLTGDESVTGENHVLVTYPNFHNEVPKGEVILYDDASMGMIVEEVLPGKLKCRIENGATIKGKKSLNIPNVHINLPPLIEKDIRFLHFCAKNKIDFIIHSFVRTVSDLQAIKDVLKVYPDYPVKIIAKIENREGFDNVAEILDNCEGVMIARGDLGAEVPMSELPYLQKRMLDIAVSKGKYVIVATEVLNNMIKNPRPTRAEVNDIAFAVSNRTDMMSMSGETAYGDYPEAATKMMSDTMLFTESKLKEFTAAPVAYKASPKAQAAFDSMEKLAASENIEVAVNLTNDYAFTREIAALRPSVTVCTTQTNMEYVRDLMLAFAIRPVFAGEDAKAAAKKELGSILGKVIVIDTDYSVSVKDVSAL